MLLIPTFLQRNILILVIWSFPASFAGVFGSGSHIRTGLTILVFKVSMTFISRFLMCNCVKLLHKKERTVLAYDVFQYPFNISSQGDSTIHICFCHSERLVKSKWLLIHARFSQPMMILGYLVKNVDSVSKGFMKS